MRFFPESRAGASTQESNVGLTKCKHLAVIVPPCLARIATLDASRIRLDNVLMESAMHRQSSIPEAEHLWTRTPLAP